jgi:L-ascorbate oxidase
MLMQQLRRDQLCTSIVVQVVAAVLCLVAAGAISYVEAAVQYYDWTVAYTYASPDCVEKLVMAVNGEVPGPRIDATEGDTVVVNLTNHLPTEGVVIHWHGMHQVRKVVLLPAGSSCYKQLQSSSSSSSSS